MSNVIWFLYRKLRRLFREQKETKTVWMNDSLVRVLRQKEMFREIFGINYFASAVENKNVKNLNHTHANKIYPTKERVRFLMN